ncbi:site-specific integrase [Lysinibacillus xylanilyticus]|uniref:site-specific integrase n=1 Tax=Lysinibacillus xylanilyticus TaxID=582475 RepID=UPI003CFE59A4
MTQKYWESTREDIPILTRKVINEYLLSLKLTNKAEATITKYRWILERFFSECLITLDELTSEDVLTWFNKFSAGKNTKTLNLFLSTLSSFFRFCLRGRVFRKHGNENKVET